MIRLVAFALALLLALPATAQETREGHRVIATEIPYAEFLPRLREAIRAEEMGLVTEAGPTEVAASRGVEIPGDRVLGVFRNDFAVRALRASRASMIEAPIRFHVRETGEGAILAWKTPSHVFGPYLAEGGIQLAEVAAELDAIFEAIAARATE
ncbi:MAG TPA: DUF302 domain-containing protein [Paracoccaceae bacterium]|nr:DUF302 domain-containing protein [Paracoccaceae bacterium]